MSILNDFEGDMMGQNPEDIASVETLKSLIAKLQNRNRAHFHSALQYAEQGGCGFGSEINSRRRFEIARGIYWLITSNQFDTDLIRDLAGFASGNTYSKVADGLANMNAEQAARFAEACFMLSVNAYDLSYDPQTSKFQIIPKTSEGGKQ
jgi:hypothetical protein